MAQERGTTEKELVLVTYERERTILATAIALGVTPQTINNIMRKHGLRIKRENALVEASQS